MHGEAGKLTNSNNIWDKVHQREVIDAHDGVPCPPWGRSSEHSGEQSCFNAVVTGNTLSISIKVPKSQLYTKT